jgi:pimeloyl-ACP methyl ester carboxylesterase
MTSYQRRLFRLSGSTISLVDFGSGPAVMLGAGILCDADCWDPQIAALSARYRVIVPEFWGHGLSGALPAGTASVRDVARQHIELLDVLDVERCAIIGLSAGGMWAAELALMAPGRVGALILLDTSLAAEPASMRATHLELLDLIERSRGFPEPIIAAAATLFFSPSVDARDAALRHEFADRLRAWDPARVLDSVVPLWRLMLNRREALAELAALAMPTLVATGSDDQARSLAEGRAMAERIGCSFVEIPAAGHTPSLEAPDYVNRLLVEFLDAHWPGERTGLRTHRFERCDASQAP